MHVTRRQLLASGAAAGLVPLASRLAAQQTPRIRRSIDQLEPGDDDLVALRDGLRIMRQRRDSLSLKRQVALHARYGRHHSWLFLPWHRAELLCLEAIIAQLTGHQRFALPYWSYRETPRLPDFFFDPGDALFHQPRKATAQTDLDAARWAKSSKVSSIVDDDFTRFHGTKSSAGMVEAFGHNLIHLLVGGDMADLATAPLDPIFFLHHCSLDRAWAAWQEIHGPQGPADWLREPLRKFVDPTGKADSLRVADTLDVARFGYRYDDNGIVPPPPPPPPPIPQIGPDGRSIEPSPTPPPPPALGRPVRFEGRGHPGPNGSELVIAVPPEVTRPVRDGMRLAFDATGTIRFDAGALRGKAIALSAQAGRGEPVRIHESPFVPHSGRDHAHGDRLFSYEFEESEALRDFVRMSTGPVVLCVQAVDQQSGSPATAAVARQFTVSLSLRPPD